jgi:uncharacterized protein YdhG (YjbR/CyaY superfamily)
MTPRKVRPKTIDEYINAAPKEARKNFGKCVQVFARLHPGPRGMPAFAYRRILVTFTAFKHHIGFYPTPSAVAAFAKDLSRFAAARGSIQFPVEKPLPLPLIRKITAFRVRESVEIDRKWKM